MAIGTGRLLARTLRDVTSVRGEELRAERFIPRVVSEAIPAAVVKPASCQVVCVASGKGGTGKTIVTTNLAVALAQEGLRVLVFDADMGLANAHLLFGVTPPGDLSSVLAGHARISEVVAECPAGVELVSGGSGFADLAELSYTRFRYLARGLEELEARADLLLVDAAAGIGPQVMRFLRAAHEVVVVTTPDVTALLDAYALLKSLVPLREGAKLRLIVNRARDRAEALEAFQKIQIVAARHLPEALPTFFGWIPQHWFVQASVRERRPVVLSHPRSFVTESIREMARQLWALHEGWKFRQGGEGVGERAEPFSSRLMQMTFERGRE